MDLPQQLEKPSTYQDFVEQQRWLWSTLHAEQELIQQIQSEVAWQRHNSGNKWACSPTRQQEEIQDELEFISSWRACYGNVESNGMSSTANNKRNSTRSKKATPFKEEHPLVDSISTINSLVLPSSGCHPQKGKLLVHPTCECCYEEKELGYFCYNQHMSHFTCLDCIGHYTRLWLYEGNQNAIHWDNDDNVPSWAVPCLCSDGCDCRVVIYQWNNILHCREIVRLQEKLLDTTRDGNVNNCSATTPNTTSSVLETNDTRIPGSHQIPAGTDDSDDDLNMGTARRLRSLENAQHALEEIKTSAKLRTCPHCRQQAFLKESGCNKLKCPACFNRSCYCCRRVVAKDGYDHFSIDGKDPKKCPLWTNEEQDAQYEKAVIREKLYQMAQAMWHAQKAT